jgi:hypothetical protein
MKIAVSCSRLALLLLVLQLPNPAQAASKTVAAGETLTLTDDLLLSGEDVLRVDGTAQKRCTIAAAGQQIRTSGKWTGRVKISHCDIRGLGTASKAALELSAAGEGKIVIEHCTFDASGPVHLANLDNSAAEFRNNTIQANALVPVTNLPNESPPGFRASGNSPARKHFQGNHVYKSVVEFGNARNWVIGGDADADGNILIGQRASLSIYRCNDFAVRGNYLHTEIPSFKWSQVHTLAVLAPCPGLVIEHNIIRHGQWVVRGLTGEFRYNLVLDADAHNFIIGPRDKCRIHHNIFARYCTIDPNLNASIGVIYKADDVQIYNNTFDGGGKDLARVWHVPAIEVSSEGFLHSLRNNVFFQHPTKFHNGTATIRPGFTEKKTDPGPARLGYADYNLFYNLDAAEQDNYALTVAGKTERADAGFARHDVPAGGARDAQAEPKFKGPVPKKFPFTDDDIKARKATVSQILAHYRTVYTPAEGSPLTGAGDPADGPGSFIGAVGAGKDPPHDQFGKFGTKSAPGTSK